MVLNEKVRILIVDDHPIVRRGVSEALSSRAHWEICGEASDGEEALEKIRQQKPDLVILDISMGGPNGIEVLQQIKEESGEVKALVLSVHDEVLFAERALQAGASGYLNKEEPMDKLVEAIDAVMGGGIYLSEDLGQRLFQRMRKKGDSLPGSPTEILSKRELEVFKLIGSGQTTATIATSLRLSSKTIETYRENIKRKLGLRNNVELLRHAALSVRPKK